jgi:hypothetical protein
MTDGHYEIGIDDATLTSDGETVVLRIFMSIIVIPTVFLIYHLVSTPMFK